MSRIEENLMYSLQFIHRISDFSFRIRNFARRKLGNRTLFSTNNHESDSQATFYQGAVSRINTNSQAKKRFRRVYDYREILEHVDYSLGRKYLEVINANQPEIWNSLNKFKENDRIGNPRTYHFPEIGKLSPTTLRYIAVATDIKRIFGISKFSNIVEIGGGYGGQAAILKKLEMFDNYSIFDLPEVQKLISHYGRATDIGEIGFPNLSDEQKTKYDLVISNYAFSELPRNIQDEYLVKVILKSQRGFMLMNSGKTNKTGRSEGKITLEELRKSIPNLQELPEVPLTSPDNYLLVWQN